MPDKVDGFDRRVVHVVVTPEDIDKGLPEDGGSCPVALALSRAGVHDVIVDEREFIDMEDPGWLPVATMADEVGDWIAAFDEGQPVGPFEFDIDLPAAYVR